MSSEIDFYKPCNNCNTAILRYELDHDLCMHCCHDFKIKHRNDIIEEYEK